MVTSALSSTLIRILPRSRSYSAITRIRRTFSTSTHLLDNNEETSDIVISGGGMVGAAMACALATNPLFSDKKVILLEAAPDKGKFILQEKYSNRTCALSPATVNFFNSFGGWDEILQMRCQPVRRMQVWESCSDSMITFNNDDMAEPLAYIVENDIILAALMQRLSEVGDRVEIRYRTKPKAYELPGVKDFSSKQHPLVGVELESGDVIRTRLLIGADGNQSAVRQAADFHTVTWDYKQKAIVATLKLAEAPDNCVAWQRFLSTGPIAMLPLRDNLSSLVWSTTHEAAKHLLSIPEDSFVDAVNDAFWNDREKNVLADKALEVFSSVVRNILPGPDTVRQLPPTVVDIEPGSRGAFPLQLIHSSAYVRPRVALIGDAAHRLHPLAGQGVNLGFGDVACLSGILTAALQNGSDLGSLTHLHDYETERQRHVVPVMGAIDGLQKLYSVDFTPIVVLRSLGLHATNTLDFIKRQIISRAAS
ncbi:ubiquinone biosynthesis monooxygenase COQ6, mitochondrial-like [Haliotis rufescens]|uniref:ubiquinone biosynthesis monooxygenase COQ6, mitochondrial-like n=1 Tax=Haliotis rufescens TaxID=6454 RepID=UPI00201E839F|nr:ubiquinone biosynthesis monooxygenase COQ6, mitochondrial-like [Haliotis rufescens]